MIRQQIFPLKITPYGTEIECETTVRYLGEGIGSRENTILTQGVLHTTDLRCAIRFLNRTNYEVVQILNSDYYDFEILATALGTK